MSLPTIPPTLTLAIREAIEATSQHIAGRLRNGTPYATAMSEAIMSSTLGPASWVLVIKRVEVLRALPSALSEDQLVTVLMDLVPTDGKFIGWRDLSMAINERCVQKNWLTVRMLLQRLQKDGVMLRKPSLQVEEYTRLR